jgi:prepilin-type N-terminal cleavage/methylation domain-containing protein
MRQGFSLVELSIVLVVIGLIVGGVMFGQNLIRNAELKSVTVEMERYKQAVELFEDQYYTLPGDIPHATDMWGSAGGSGTIGDGCESATGTGTETCSGDGNGEIATNPAGPGEYVEYFTAWQHLANAGLIEGQYTGRNGPGSTSWDSVINENVPSSSVTDAGWFIGDPMYNISGSANYFDGTYSHRLIFGSDLPDETTAGPALTPQEAWSIDTKVDDGAPGTGKVRAFKNSSTKTPGCATTDDPTTAEYTLSDDAILCSLIFTPGF